MSPSVQLDVTLPAGFPRVSGDEPWDTIWQGISLVFSPREWG